MFWWLSPQCLLVKTPGLLLKRPFWIVDHRFFLCSEDISIANSAQAAPPIPLRRALTNAARDWTRSCRATMQHPGPPSSSRHSGSVYHTFYCVAIKKEASMRVATHVDLLRKSKHGTRVGYIPVSDPPSARLICLFLVLVHPGFYWFCPPLLFAYATFC